MSQGRLWRKCELKREQKAPIQEKGEESNVKEQLILIVIDGGEIVGKWSET